MWDRAAELDIPLMAGSCLPLAWRRPWVEHDKGVVIDEAVAVAMVASRLTGITH
jgi:hypothetical protein